MPFSSGHLVSLSDCSIVWRQKPLTRTMKYIKVSSWNVSLLRDVMADTSFSQPVYRFKVMRH